MAKVDGPRSLNPGGFWASLARKLFGITVARSLANEGLEELRRFCVRAWHWDLIRTSDIGALIDVGYSRRDAQQILAHVASRRGFMPSVEDDLLNIGSGLEGPCPPSRRSSGPTHALPASQAARAPWRGQGDQVRRKRSRVAEAVPAQSPRPPRPTSVIGAR